MLEALVCRKDWLFLEKVVGMDNQVQYQSFFVFICSTQVCSIFTKSLLNRQNQLSWLGLNLEGIGINLQPRMVKCSLLKFYRCLFVFGMESFCFQNTWLWPCLCTAFLVVWFGPCTAAQLEQPNKNHQPLSILFMSLVLSPEQNESFYQFFCREQMIVYMVVDCFAK